MIKLILIDSIIPNFGIKLTEQNNQSPLTKPLLEYGNNMFLRINGGKILLPHSPTKDSFHKRLAIRRHFLIRSIQFSNGFLKQHGVNLLIFNRSSEHWLFVEYGHVVVDYHVLDYAVFVKTKFVDAVGVQGFV